MDSPSEPSLRDGVDQIVLSHGWALSHLGGAPAPFDIDELPVRVPGCVHTDLLDAGLIADPYHGTNEHLTDWIGRSDFRYRCRFETPAEDTDPHPRQAERTTLRLEGVDTIADIILNGTVLGRVRDMHRSHEFDVTDLLAGPAEGGNVLDVVIHAPVTEARAAAERMGDRPQNGNAYPFNAIRKMACNFGWDWGPDLVTSGVLRPVRLIRWHTARLRDPLSVVASLDTRSESAPVGTVRVRPLLEVDPALSPTADLTTVGLEAAITVTGPFLPGSAASSGTTPSRPTPSAPLSSARVRLTGGDDISLSVPGPELWWPVGEGDQPLYSVEITLIGPDGTVLDRRRRQVGFRSVELLTRPDEFGTGFTVRVNGRDLFLRGANWIPDDAFVSRVSHADLQRGIDDALEAHMNVLRVWGGGLFADEWMLQRCDELGVMVWQDFLFACAAYSEDPELSEQVRAEAVENVIRMASHPSLILWNGCNENVEGYVHWGWQDHLEPGQSWGLGYYTELLPQIVDRWDGTRPYTPTSPFNPQDLMDPRDPDHGSVHSWSVWNQIDYTHYRDTVPRFCAEFGFQGPAERATIAEYLDDDPLTPSCPGMLLHEKAADGLRKLDDGFAPHLPQPVDFEDWHFTTSLNQARAMECGISWFRSWWPRCAGSIIWQLNDTWPVSSWAAVDSTGRRKLLWYALRDLYDDHFLTIQPRPARDGREAGSGPVGSVLNRSGAPTVIASNLSGRPWRQTLTVQRCRLDGRVLDTFTTPVTADARSNVTVALPAGIAGATVPREELLVARLGERRALWWFVEDLDLALEPARLEVTAGEGTITATARNLVKDLTLLCPGDPGDPEVSHGLRRVTLLPGETATFHTSRPAGGARLRSVNDLLDASRGGRRTRAARRAE